MNSCHDNVSASFSEGTELVSETISVRLQAIVYAAQQINLYQFSRLDGGALAPYRPGAHIDLMLPNGRTRQYSLVHPYADGRPYTIGVKLEDAGRGGSHYIHRSMRVGDVLTVSAPRNHFALDETARHTVLIAGGIGITPIWCMLERLESLGLSWELHYAARSRIDAVFLERIKHFGDRAHLYFNEDGSMLSLQAISAHTGKDAHVYCCGPTPMLNDFKGAFADHPAELVHYEYFKGQPIAANADAFVVKLARSDKEILVSKGSSILDAITQAGIQVASSCHQGVCGACETAVISGIPDHRDMILSESEKAANKTMMICCSGCKQGPLVLDL